MRSHGLSDDVAPRDEGHTAGDTLQEVPPGGIARTERLSESRQGVRVAGELGGVLPDEHGDRWAGGLGDADRRYDCAQQGACQK